jgi:hypothetical protein
VEQGLPVAMTSTSSLTKRRGVKRLKTHSHELLWHFFGHIRFCVFINGDMPAFAFTAGRQGGGLCNNARQYVAKQREANGQ